MMSMDNSVNMSVSSVCEKDGKRYAFVSFTRGEDFAEGKIPDCKIIAGKGFTGEETVQLEEYMQSELPKLKQMASGIRVIDAFMK